MSCRRDYRSWLRLRTAAALNSGILFLDVPPGDYTLTASKPGVTFRAVRVRCEAGVLVNPSPPWSLQAL